MARPTKLDTIDDIKMWIADHDGRIDAYWEAQFKLNDKTEGKFVTFGDNTEGKFAAYGLRLAAVERRVMWFAGVAAGIGSVVGGLLTKVW